MSHSPYFLMLFILLLSCQDRATTRVIGMKGNVLTSERRMPLYNRQMMDRMPEIINHSKNNYKIDDVGDVYYSTGKVEGNRLNPLPERNIPNIKAEDTKFVQIQDISLNENKNIEHSKQILLNKQNILTNHEYKIKKVPTPQKNNKQNEKQVSQKKREPIISKAKTPVGIPKQIIEQPKSITAFIKVIESESLFAITDQLKNVKQVTDKVVTIEEDKKNNLYKLIIGPITDQKELNKIKQDLINKGYSNLKILEK